MMWKTSALVVATVGSTAAQTSYKTNIYNNLLFVDNRDQAQHWQNKCVASSFASSSDSGGCNLGYAGPNCNTCAPNYFGSVPDPTSGIVTCTMKVCDPKLDCHSEWNEVASSPTGRVHFCATSATNTDKTCTCTGQVEGAKCEKCKPNFTNWPHCDVPVGNPMVLADEAKTTGCSGHAKLNPHYAGNSVDQVYDLSSKANIIGKMSALGWSECGSSWCTNSEKCHSWPAFAGTMSPDLDGQWIIAPMLGGMKCIRKGFVGCGPSECAPGELCLDAAGTCTTNYPLLHAGRTPCVPYVAFLNNGTQLPGVAGATTEFCEAWETCCDGICCNDGGRFASDTRAREGVCTERAAQAEPTSAFGYDFRWSATNPGGGAIYLTGFFKHMARKYCDPFTFNALHGFRIVLIPILLTFVYILAMALGVKAGSPGPIKIIGLVMLVICVFSAYHYEWQKGAFLALVVVISLFGTGTGRKPGMTSFLVILLQLIVFSMLFRVPIFDFLVSSYFDNYMGLSERNALETCAQTYSYFKSHHYSLPYNEEVTWMFQSTSDVRWGYPMRQRGDHHIQVNPQIDELPFWTTASGIGYVPMELYHGYCAMGWIAAMDFFYAVQGFLLLALMMFSGQHHLNGGATTNGKSGASVQPQEVP